MKYKINYPLKIWLYSISILFITLGIGLVVYFYFTAFYLNKIQKQNFDKSVQNIVEVINDKGIEKNSLNRYLEEGYMIVIQEKQNNIYSKSLKQEYDLEEQESQKRLLIDKKSTSYKGEKFEVTVAYPVSVTSSDYRVVLYQALPIFSLVGIFIASIISIIYSKLFSKEIRSINQVISEMDDLTFDKKNRGHFIHTQDEMKLLKHNLSELHFKLKDTLNSLETELNHTQKLEQERQIFMKGITHELKTPIMAMGLLLEGMLSDLPEYESKEIYLQKCYKELQKMSKLVTEVLEISKIESFHQQGKCNVKKSLEEVINDKQVLIDERKITIVYNLDSRLEINLSEKLMLKVFSNLLGNSISYSPYGSEILIKEQEKNIVIINEIDKDEKINIEEIFQPFYTKGSEEGHGLGLYIVKNILESSGYEILCRIYEEVFEVTITLK